MYTRFEISCRNKKKHELTTDGHIVTPMTLFVISTRDLPILFRRFYSKKKSNGFSFLCLFGFRKSTDSFSFYFLLPILLAIPPIPGRSKKRLGLFYTRILLSVGLVMSIYLGKKSTGQPCNSEDINRKRLILVIHTQEYTLAGLLSFFLHWWSRQHEVCVVCFVALLWLLLKKKRKPEHAWHFITLAGRGTKKSLAAAFWNMLITWAGERGWKKGFLPSFFPSNSLFVSKCIGSVRHSPRGLFSIPGHILLPDNDQFLCLPRKKEKRQYFVCPFPGSLVVPPMYPPDVSKTWWYFILPNLAR